MKIQAFSLIELMVVIAIVAILAAVAAPAYMAYSSYTKISSGIQGVNSWIKLYQLHQNSKGSFPYTACDVGLPSDCNGPVSGYSTVPASAPATVNDYAIKPYVYSVTFAPFAGSNCSILRTEAVMVGYQPPSSSGDPLFDYQVITRDKGGVWEQSCMYFSQNGSTIDTTSNIHIKGCYNGADTTEFSNFQDLSNQWFAECT